MRNQPRRCRVQRPERHRMACRDQEVGMSMDMHYFQLGRHDRDFLHAQWVSLASQFASDHAEIENLFNSIVEHHSAKNRAYHNLSHIQSLLSLSESLPDKFQNRDALYFAVWFHDVIYD